MTTEQILPVITGPIGQMGLAALLGLLGLVLAAILKGSPELRAHAQVLADLSEALEPMVLQAERAFPGARMGNQKLSLVIDHAQAWMHSQGIDGDAKRVADTYLPGLIEITVKNVTKGKGIGSPPNVKPYDMYSHTKKTE